MKISLKYLYMFYVSKMTLGDLKVLKKATLGPFVRKWLKFYDFIVQEKYFY